MLVVRNDDVPGMIGTVGTILGDAEVNIDDMDVGQTRRRRGRAMACRPRPPSPDDVVAALRAQDGIVDARAIELD